MFESYVHKEFPIAFYSDEECFSLYSVRSILTVPEHARRVYRGIFKRSKRATELLHRAFLTCMEDKELHLYTFVRKLMDEGPDFLRNQSDAAYYPVAKALRHMSGELEKLRGFIRFSEYSGVLGSSQKIESSPCCETTSAIAMPTNPFLSTTVHTRTYCYTAAADPE